MLNKRLNNKSFPGANWCRNALHTVLRAILRNLHAERDRWVLWLPVLVGIGVGFYFVLPTEPPAVPTAGVTFAAVIVAVLTRRRPATRFVTIGLAAAAIGFAAAQWRTLVMQEPVLHEEIGPTSVQGRIVAMDPLPGGVRVVLEGVRIGGLPPYDTPDRVRVTVRSGTGDAVPGDWIRLYAVLSPFSRPVTPGGFDFQRYAYFQGLGGTGYALGGPRELKHLNPGTFQEPGVAVERLRLAMTRRVRAAVSSEAGTVAAALITGMRRAIPESVVTVMRDSGLAHLLAISGLHIGLIAGLVFFAVRGGLALVPSLAVRHPIKKWAAVAALLTALGYAVIAGATVPTLRAFSMAGLVLIAVLLDRRGITMRLVAWAAVAILLFRPDSMLGPSFQMSFAAVTALVATYEVVRGRFRELRQAHRGTVHRMGLYLGSVVLSTVVAGAATGPFAAYHFNVLAAYGVIANAVAVPLTGLWIMPWAIVGVALMPFGLEAVGLVPMSWGIDGMLAVARWVAGLPGSIVTVPALPAVSLFAVVSGGLWLCLWQRTWRLAGVGAIGVGVLLGILHDRPALLAAGDASVFAVRTVEGLHPLSPAGRPDRFILASWERRSGARSAIGADNRGEAPPETSCDWAGCVIRQDGRRTSLVWHEGALIEDCWTADILISAVPIRTPCPAPSITIDRFDLWRGGTHAVWIDDAGIRVRNVEQERGDRPWVVRRQ